MSKAAGSLPQVAKEIAVLSRAGYPLIYVVTAEEDRALGLIEMAAAAARKGAVRWSSTLGFQDDEPSVEGGAEAGARAAGGGGAGVATGAGAGVAIAAGAGAVAQAMDALGRREQPALFALLDLHPFLGDPSVVRRLRERLSDAVARRQSFVIVAPLLVLPPELEKDTAVIDLPLPRAPDLLEELRRVAVSERVAVDEIVEDKAVRSALGLSLNEAQRVFRKVMVLKKGLSEDDLKMIVEEKKRVLRRTDVLEFYQLGESLSDVGGLGEMKKWLAARTEAFGQQARDFGLPPPKGLLLLGVQGCGKSLSAKAVAELWKFPLLRLDVGAVFSGAGGAPEAAIRESIKIAESLAPVVLWIDELEKGFGQVEGDESSMRVFGSFITWLSEKTAEVFVVATANDVSRLPPELLRRGRFDEIFFVDLPNQHERLEIMKIHIKKRGRHPESFPTLSKLAKVTEHFSGAELEQVVISSLYRAFAEKREMNDHDLELAVKEVVPLYETFEDRIKWLRDWARTRARSATLDSSVLDLFGE
ncbi:MAG: AAA family ATPase [Deltaproteobacteria bacterium]|nr:AAA family ATPase [Deltaproteobacteria bacterium]